MSERSPRLVRLRQARERGATAVEYGVLVAIFAVGLIGGTVLLQDGVKAVFVAQTDQISDPGPGSSSPTPTPSSPTPTPSSPTPTPSSPNPTPSSPTPTPTILPDYAIDKGVTIRLNLLPGLPPGATVTGATRVGDGTIGVTSGDFTYTAAQRQQQVRRNQLHLFNQRDHGPQQQGDDQYLTQTIRAHEAADWAGRRRPEPHVAHARHAGDHTRLVLRMAKASGRDPPYEISVGPGVAAGSRPAHRSGANRAPHVRPSHKQSRGVDEVADGAVVRALDDQPVRVGHDPVG